MLRKLEFSRIEIENLESKVNQTPENINETSDATTLALQEEKNSKIVINESVIIFEHGGKVF